MKAVAGVTVAVDERISEAVIWMRRVYTEDIEVEVGGIAVGTDFYPAPGRSEVRPHGHQFRRDGVERACLCRAARSRLLPTTTFSLSTFLSVRLVRRLR